VVRRFALSIYSPVKPASGYRERRKSDKPALEESVAIELFGERYVEARCVWRGVVMFFRV